MSRTFCSIVRTVIMQCTFTTAFVIVTPSVALVSPMIGEGILYADVVGIHPYGYRPFPNWPSPTWFLGMSCVYVDMQS